jgi:predicted DNA-binding transcriptional regulator YafY
MAVTKNADMRYKIIDKCLSSKQHPYCSTEYLLGALAAKDLKIQARALMYDIESMRYDERLGFLAPISYCKRNKGYYYTDPEYSIHKLKLSPENLRALSLALNILRQFKGIRMVKEFEAALDKILKMVSHLDVPQTESVITLDTAPYNKSLEYFDIVLKSVHEQQALEIIYEKHSKERNRHKFHPYFVVGYKGIWYVLGYSENRKGIVTLGLDRFKQADVADIPFIKNTLLKPEEHFRHTIGITHTPGPPENIELLFSPTQANYIKTQHLHHTQETINDDVKGLHIRLKLKPNYELHSLLLSFGHEVEVLKPLSLRKKMVESVEKIRMVYNK